MWKKFLIWIGFLTECCGATSYYDEVNRMSFCNKCDKRVGKN